MNWLAVSPLFCMTNQGWHKLTIDPNNGMPAACVGREQITSMGHPSFSPIDTDRRSIVPTFARRCADLPGTSIHPDTALAKQELLDPVQPRLQIFEVGGE